MVAAQLVSKVSPVAFQGGFQIQISSIYIYHLITPTSLVGLRKLIIALLIFSNSSCSVERTRISDMSSLKDKPKTK